MCPKPKIPKTEVAPPPVAPLPVPDPVDIGSGRVSENHSVHGRDTPSYRVRK